MGWPMASTSENYGAICPPPSPQTCPFDAVLAVGFGSVDVKRNGVLVWTGDDECVTLEGFEDAASCDKDPESKWTVTFDAPMASAVYERRKDECGGVSWVLVKRGAGFA